MKTPKKKQPVKARKDWACGPNGTVYSFCIPATQEAYDAMVRQGALAIGRRAYKAAKATDINDPACYTRKPEAKDIEFYSKYTAAALAAIGITKPIKPVAARENEG